MPFSAEELLLTVFRMCVFRAASLGCHFCCLQLEWATGNHLQQAARDKVWDQW